LQAQTNTTTKLQTHTTALLLENPKTEQKNEKTAAS